MKPNKEGSEFSERRDCSLTRFGLGTSEIEKAAYLLGYKDKEIEYDKALSALREAVKVIDLEHWALKITCKKLIDDKPDRDWILEKDIDRWSSLTNLEDLSNKIKASFPDLEKETK